MFSVVLFSATKEVAVVPRSWIVERDFCYWPPKTMRVKILSLISKSITASSTWDLYHVKVLGTYATYGIARKKLSKAASGSERSDISSTDPEECGRGKRPHKRKTADSSDSEGDLSLMSPPASLSLSFLDSALPAVPIQKTGSTKHAALSQEVPVLKTPVFPTQLEVSNFAEEETESLLDGLDCSESLLSKTKENYYSPDCAEIATTSTSTNCNCNCSGFQKSILREIQLMKTNQRSLLENLDAIRRLLETREEKNASVDQPSGSLLEITELLPICNASNLQRVEEKLLDNNVSNQLVEFLLKIGGATVDNGVKNMLKRLLTDDFASLFSYFGVREKNNFNQLKLCQVIHDTVHRNVVWRGATDMDISKTIMNWLRHAKARSQNKNKNKI